ncbi:MAG: NAD-dependent protein deacetylase [Gammaproteobacteria bacterium]
MFSTLLDLFKNHNQVVVLTGAGVSTASGLPDYRDENGAWKHSRPMEYQDFISSQTSRRRYWARSAVGRERFKAATPNKAHVALARLEALAKVSLLITQNVDQLHQRAGSRRVVDLHGTLDQVVCLGCSSRVAREKVQHYLLRNNPVLENITSIPAPDGEAQLEAIDFSQIEIPQCERCGGILKPDVVFYGESVPSQRVETCFNALDRADAMLIAGSSLMVYSGYRFARRAHENKIPIVAINRGVTRADDILSMKIEQDCGPVLEEVVEALDSFNDDVSLEF